MRPVIIVGAPRSGTNMLRDVLARVPGYATWPCDEINLTWRHGHRDHPSDELPPELATPPMADYMRRQFSKVAAKYDAHTVVEKTCANSLRVPFVDRCLPDARFLFITRDGLDAVPSAMKRWHAPLDIPYTARKMRHAPWSDLPHYAARFFANRLHRRNDERDARVRSWWGPALRDRAQLTRDHPLDELCAIQWQRCVDASLEAFDAMPHGKVHHLHYEQFVADPVSELESTLRFLGDQTAVDPAWVADVSSGSVGKGRQALGSEAVQRLSALVRPTLARLGHA